MVLFIRSRICLLILPISDLAGLMRRQVGLLAKLGLWSLRYVSITDEEKHIILHAKNATLYNLRPCILIKAQN